MPSDIDSRKSRNGCTEKHAVSHVGNAAHRLISSPVAACRRTVFRKSQSQAACGNRFKLPALVKLEVREKIGRFKYTLEDKLDEEYKNIMDQLAKGISNVLGKEGF